MDVKALAAGIPVRAAPPAPHGIPASGAAAAAPQAAISPRQSSASASSSVAARALSISVDKETGKTVVQIINAEDGSVIRQIPAEEMLALARSLGRAQGVALSTKT